MESECKYHKFVNTKITAEITTIKNIVKTSQPAKQRKPALKHIQKSAEISHQKMVANRNLLIIILLKLM